MRRSSLRNLNGLRLARSGGQGAFKGRTWMLVLALNILMAVVMSIVLVWLNIERMDTTYFINIQKSELRDKQGLTVVVVSHNMDDLAELCDYVLVLNEGRLFALGEPATVFADERKLKDVGLGVPHAVHLANRLKNAGIELPISPVPSFDELASAIASDLAVQEGR